MVPIPPLNGGGSGLRVRLDFFAAPSDGKADVLFIVTVIKSAGPSLGQEHADREEELQGYISALEQSSADIPALKNTALLCTQMPVIEASSPTSPDFSAPLTPSPAIGNSDSLPSFAKTFWSERKNLDRLFDALVSYLNPNQVSTNDDVGSMMAHSNVTMSRRMTRSFSTVSLYCGK